MDLLDFCGISIHAPRTGSDDNLQSVCVICHISIHAPRTGSDGEIMHTGFLGTFQSTLPARGATRVYASPLRRMHFNPRSPHGERLLLPDAPAVADGISIHAPRTGSDRRRDAAVAHLLSISIHAPRTGSDQPQAGLWRHTKDFNPRSPHGERRKVLANWDNDLIISIHAPRTGSDARKPLPRKHPSIFQSTLPARGTTQRRLAWSSKTWDFNPRSPHGERPRGYLETRRPRRISIHAPRTGSDAA